MNSIRTHPLPWLVRFVIRPAEGEGLRHDADEGVRHVEHQVLHRLEELAVDRPGDDLRFGDLHLVALTAHRLDEDGELQLAAAADLGAVGGAGVDQADRDVAEDLPIGGGLEVSAG